jgi:DNA-binding IclR family transcriptional regulator
MQTLANYGYAEKDLDTQRYRLGPKIVELSQSLLARMPFRDEAKPYLRELVAITNECAHLAIAAQGQVLYIDQVDSPATLRVNADIGHLASLHCTALGKVLLAFGNVPLPTELTAHTPRTITNAEALQMHLEQVKRQGYAIDDEEYDYGVRCIAAPVYNLNGEMVAAMGISGPSNRMNLEIISTMAAKVTGVAQALSDHLSFKRP